MKNFINSFFFVGSTLLTTACQTQPEANSSQSGSEISMPTLRCDELPAVLRGAPLESQLRHDGLLRQTMSDEEKEAVMRKYTQHLVRAQKRCSGHM